MDQWPAAGRFNTVEAEKRKLPTPTLWHDPTRLADWGRHHHAAPGL